MLKVLPSFVLGLALLVLLLANAPARLLLSVVPSDQVILQGLSGTLWNGHAGRALVASGAGWLHLGATRWQLSPLSLLTLTPRIEIASQWGRQTLAADITLHSQTEIELQQVDLLVEAALLRQYLPVGLVGDLSLQFDEILIEGNTLGSAKGRIVWRDGGWISPQGRRLLGSYAIDVASLDPGGVRGEVVSLAGDLQASGTIELQQSQYNVDVLLSGQGLDDPQLRQALQLVAIPQNDDFRVKLQGKL